MRRRTPVATASQLSLGDNCSRGPDPGQKRRRHNPGEQSEGRDHQAIATTERQLFLAFHAGPLRGCTLLLIDGTQDYGVTVALLWQFLGEK